MTEEGGRPPAAFEERGRSPATSGGLRTAPTIADGWLRRPAARQAQILFKILSPDGIPCWEPVSLGAFVNSLVLAIVKSPLLPSTGRSSIII
jgi:hypothetical protein